MDSYFSEDSGDDGAKDGAMPNPDGDGTETMDTAKGDGEGDEKGEESTAETTLMPKSMLAGKEFNVGDEVVMKIVRMDGDEVEVAYATGEDKGKGGKDEDTESRMAKYADKE